ncbi:hypothetical protein PFICI_15169 [Pestalotiopsis fici W106-1]|uniref:non-specific serine/threonine protein kinase n=1 Tax=Pestalotiopsis fici (strain W106-1 / CGMCC3.15140) TaxID=1229662 RepID=W3WHI0_PESFW|nr:uncharacterized protein PFICI_15169 [Pestalotiopsis fici W106-1]ETS73224.1 hypothetical protein PFICI_15169 [Pestalotiopsis fici W106-1]
MELIPYTSREGREIVLRHRNALVVRDPTSQRLDIRGLSLTECPTCHQPLRTRSSSPERHFESPATHDESYMNPNYFRMLRAARRQAPPHPPSSPIRRLTQPNLPVYDESAVHDDVGEDAEFVSSAPAPGPRITREAFSPNYFRTFFVEERELGRGGKGVVLLVRHEIDGCHLGHFACKRVPVGDDHAWLEKVLVEVELLAKLSHPNLVSYRHVWLEDVKLLRFGPSVACAFILQQYCNGGDLLRYVVGDQPKEKTKEQLKAQMRRRSKGQAEKPDLFSQRHLTFDEIYSLFRDIVSGLAYLHGSNYIHRDLKPSNCLLHQEHGKLTCLISDFGEVQPENAVRKSTGTTGTISYCAPEVLTQDGAGRFGNFSTKSDVFSLGMILYFLCFGRLPYANANTIQEELEDIDLLRAEIADWKGFQDEQRERPDLPAKLYHLLKQMLALNPTDRPTAADVLDAMNHESNMGTPRRESMGASPPLNMHERRVHSLDSPLVPGTPVAEPIKHQRFRVGDESVNGDKIAWTPPESTHAPADLAGTLQKHPKSSRHGHPHVTVLSRAQDGQARDSVWSDDEANDHSPRASPPLLMPPPSTFWGDVQHRRALAWHGLSHFYNDNNEAVIFMVRFSSFMVKMISLARVCRPLAARLEISTALIGLAAMDLGAPRGDELIGSHKRNPPRQPYRSSSTRWRWGWRLSMVMFMLHFVVLWSADQWGRLCNTRWDYSEHE